MTIHDKHAFEDAQIMARAAIEMTERWWKEAYWYGAMQALKAAYKAQPVVVTISQTAAGIALAKALSSSSADKRGEIIEAPTARIR